jgi:hypothetical protein
MLQQSMPYAGKVWTHASNFDFNQQRLSQHHKQPGKKASSLTRDRIDQRLRERHLWALLVRVVGVGVAPPGAQQHTETLGNMHILGVLFLLRLSKAECVHTRKGLALPPPSHSSDITLAGSRCAARLRQRHSFVRMLLSE